MDVAEDRTKVSVAIMPSMSTPADPPQKELRPRVVPAQATPSPEDETVCERCGTAGKYRIHAVSRCPACGYKTDCCGVVKTANLDTTRIASSDPGRTPI